jgi:hypothetical protein
MRKTSSWPVIAIALVVALSLAMPGALATGSGDYPYSGSGAWRITRDTELSGETVVLNGDLVIEDGARLVLTDCTIIINCSFSDQYSIVIRPFASLQLVRSAIAPLNASHHYKLVIEEHPASSWPLAGDVSFVVGVLVGMGIAFPAGIAITAYLYKKWFSRNLPPPV